MFSHDDDATKKESIDYISTKQNVCVSMESATIKCAVNIIGDYKKNVPTIGRYDRYV